MTLSLDTPIDASMSVSLFDQGGSQSMAEKVFYQLQEQIETGVLVSGAKISESDIAQRLDVSRVPVREAISRLQACGLVERKVNVGARVVTLSNQQLLEIYHIRESLEGLAAKMAASHIRPEQLTYLQDLLASQKPNLSRNQEYYQQQGDFDFHYLIAQASGNTHLIRMLTDNVYYLARVYRFQYGMRGRRVELAHKEHTAVVDAIAEGDGEMAENMIRYHIRLSRQHVEKQL